MAKKKRTTSAAKKIPLSREAKFDLKRAATRERRKEERAGKRLSAAKKAQRDRPSPGFRITSAAIKARKEGKAQQVKERTPDPTGGISLFQKHANKVLAKSRARSRAKERIASKAKTAAFKRAVKRK